MAGRIDVVAVDDSGAYRVRKLHTTSAAENRVQVLTPGLSDGYHRTYHPDTGFVHDVTTNPRSETSTGHLPQQPEVREMLWAREDLRAGELSRFELWSGQLPSNGIIVDLRTGPAYQRYEAWLVRPDLVSALKARITNTTARVVQFCEEPDGELLQLHAVFVPS